MNKRDNNTILYLFASRYRKVPTLIRTVISNIREAIAPKILKTIIQTKRLSPVANYIMKIKVVYYIMIIILLLGI